MKSTKHRPLTIETLTTRILLAADLAISVDEFVPATRGEEITRTVRVFNNGTDAAEDVLVRAQFPDLDEVTWSRRAGYAQLVHVVPDSDAPDLSFTSTDRLQVTGLGDINGDRFGDFGVSTMDSNRHFVVFGGATRAEVSVASDVSIQDGSLAVVELQLSHEKQYAPWIPLDDVNNDGFADFEIDRVTVFGRPDFANEHTKYVSVPPRRDAVPLGDLNGDGVVDFGYSQFLQLGSTANSQPAPVGIALDRARPTVKLGDINGDGFDDVRFGSWIVLGSPELGSETVSAENLRPSQIIRVAGDAQELSGIGDLNADGFDDLQLVRSWPNSRIIWGRSNIADAEFIDDTTQPSLPVGDWLTGLRNIGDLNGDGLDDLATTVGDVKIYLRGPEFDPNSGSAFSVLMPGELRNNILGHHYELGDLNNDGLSDLIVNASGPDCGCTATDRSSWDHRYGMVVAYGRPDLGDESTVVPDVVIFGAGAQSPTDRNGDGIDDISSGRSVIFGGDTLGNLNLFADGEQSFNGENGYSEFGSGLASDINRDGLLDRLMYHNAGRQLDIHYGTSSPSPLTSDTTDGAGALLDEVTIPPGRSFIYEITGHAIKSPTDKFFATVSIDATEQNVEDNVFPRDTHAAQLQVSANMSTTPTSKQNQLVDLEITIHNSGPDQVVAILDTGISERSLSWHAQLKPLFTPVPSSLAGPHLAGRDLDPDQYFRGEELGSEVGRAGDVDGDGRADLFARTREGIRILWGSDRFANDFGHTTLVIEERGDRIRALRGDVNGDGLADFMTENERGNRIRVAFGNPEIAEKKTVGSREFDRVLVDTNFRQLAPLGDVNGDGFLDWTAGERILLGTESGIIGEDGSLVGQEIISSHPVMGISDMNADGLDDFAVDPGDQKVLIGFGRAEFDDALDVANEPHHELISGEGIPLLCSSCLAQGIDVNGDGINDFAFVAEGWHDDQFHLHILYGRPDLAGAKTNFSRPQPNGGLLRSFETVPHDVRLRHDDFAFGDLDGDGVDEFIYLSWNPSGPILTAETLAHEQNRKYELTTVDGKIVLDSVFDVSGDGIDDLLVGDRPNEFNERNIAGQVFLVKGRRETVAGKGELPSLAIPAIGTMVVRVTGTFSKDTKLPNQVRVELATDQVFLDPRLQVADITSTNRPDLNQDGAVDFADFLILAANFGQKNAAGSDGDLDGDLAVNFRDFLLLSAAFADQ